MSSQSVPYALNRTTSASANMPPKEGLRNSLRRLIRTRRAMIWSTVDGLRVKPDCPGLWWAKRWFCILPSKIFANSLPGAERRVTPRWPPHSLRSPMSLKIGIIITFLQSAEISQVFQVLLNTLASHPRSAPQPAFSNSTGILQTPAAFSDFMLLAVRGVISDVLISKVGRGTFSSSSKYPTHLYKTSSPFRTFTSSQITKHDLGVRFFPATVQITLNRRQVPSYLCISVSKPDHSTFWLAYRRPSKPWRQLSLENGTCVHPYSASLSVV